MLAEQTSDPPLDDLEPVTTATGIAEVIDEATRVFVEESLHRYVVASSARRATTRGSTSGRARAPGSRSCASPRRARSPTGATTCSRRRAGGRHGRSRAPADPRARSARERDHAAAARARSRRAHPGSRVAWPG